MSPLPCRIILSDHASRLPAWEALRATSPPDLLTPLDPRPFAFWDVSALAAVYQVGPGPMHMLDVLPVLARLQACKCRLCFTRDQDHVLAIVEKRERTPVDIAAMGRELFSLLHAASAPGEDDTPVFIAAPPPIARPGAALLPRVNDPTSLILGGLRPVVLVDDDLMVRGVCTRILQSHFIVFEASGSHDALALIDRIPFPLPLLISDITLPRMDGVALAHLWLQRFDGARVLLLSGNPYAGNLAPEIRFLQKPFVADELIRTLQQLAEVGAKDNGHFPKPHTATATGTHAGSARIS